MCTSYVLGFIKISQLNMGHYRKETYVYIYVQENHYLLQPKSYYTTSCPALQQWTKYSQPFLAILPDISMAWNQQPILHFRSLSFQIIFTDPHFAKRLYMVSRGSNMMDGRLHSKSWVCRSTKHSRFVDHCPRLLHFTPESLFYINPLPCFLPLPISFFLRVCATGKHPLIIFCRCTFLSILLPPADSDSI